MKLQAFMLAAVLALAGAENLDERKASSHSNYGDIDPMEDRAHLLMHLRAEGFDQEAAERMVSNWDSSQVLFHLYKLHDTNGDDKLDGHEISVMVHDFLTKTEDNYEQAKEGEKIMEWVDHVLAEDDLNGDGQIDYVEYRKSQSMNIKKDEGAAHPFFLGWATQ
eukprot:Clim_evm26s224 gene=Clim_evmTU26s224